VTIALRDVAFPDVSVARMAMVLNPTSSGMVALHSEVPVAVPDCPKLFDQVTDATATLSDAVPLNTIEAADVDGEMEDGETMVKPGGVLSPEVGAVGVAGAIFCRVIVAV
jgi:hypothetical protein